MPRSRAALVAALVLLTAMVASTSASAITIRPSGSITSTGNLTFRTSVATIACRITLSQTVTAGTYSAGQTYGSMTRAATSGCTGGSVTIGGLPAAMVMGALRGTSQHKLIAWNPLLIIGSDTCLWRGEIGADYDTRSLLTVDVFLTLELDVAAPLTSFGCIFHGDMAISGFGTLSPAITVTLP